MRVLMRTYGRSYGFGDPIYGDCECALLDFDHELLEYLREKERIAVDLLQQDKSLASLAWFGCEPEFASYSLISDLEDRLGVSALDEFWDGGPLALPERFSVDESWMTSTECERLNAMLVYWEQKSSVRFYWSAKSRHCDASVETNDITVALLEELLNSAAA